MPRRAISALAVVPPAESRSAVRRPSRHGDQPPRGARARSSPSTPAARPARPRPHRRPGASVVSSSNVSPGCAAACNRAATLTASPVASRSSVPVTTSPVQTPIRPSMPRSGMAICISAAAWSARTASSSCTAGTPKTAITASPMNFSTDAAVALDDRLHLLEVPGEQGAQRLRIDVLAERRRAHDVAEQHGYDLALHVRSLGLCFTPALSADQERSVRGAVHIHREWLCDHFGGYEPCFDERSTWESWRM